MNQKQAIIVPNIQKSKTGLKVFNNLLISCLTWLFMNRDNNGFLSYMKENSELLQFI